MSSNVFPVSLIFLFSNFSTTMDFENSVPSPAITLELITASFDFMDWLDTSVYTRSNSDLKFSSAKSISLGAIRNVEEYMSFCNHKKTSGSIKYGVLGCRLYNSNELD
ncbi:unnamed protein product [Cuscuta epithymum]|uniref:Uncharacterized protein n=1 Tax=Cuscuta epithymum TaxID=186058 RepID=A0AAV0D1K0_9ASTE|nr:unnamed protein product [Cuscuta epithymum]